jgi:hypothetical protein
VSNAVSTILQKSFSRGNKLDAGPVLGGLFLKTSAFRADPSSLLDYQILTTILHLVNCSLILRKAGRVTS